MPCAPNCAGSNGSKKGTHPQTAAELLLLLMLMMSSSSLSLLLSLSYLFLLLLKREP